MRRQRERDNGREAELTLDESKTRLWTISCLEEICDIINSGRRRKSKKFGEQRERERERDRRRRRRGWERVEEENNGEKRDARLATGVSSHSPSLGCRTRRCVSACAQCGTDSWPSEKSLNKIKIKGEDTDLDIQLPEVVEEHLDPVVVLCLVQDDKLHVCFFPSS